MSAEQVKPGYKRTEVGVTPYSWDVLPFRDAVAAHIDYRGRTPKKLGMDWGGGDILALSANNVQMGGINIAREAYYGSDELYRKWMTQGDCEQGDVLITMEAPLGNIAQIPDSKRYILSQRVLLIKPKSVLFQDFLAHYMRGSYFQEQLVANSSGSTALGIQRSRLDEIPIAVAPIHEQRAIAAALSDVDALLTRLDQLIAKKRDLKQAAMQQLLTGQTRLPGFSGEWEVKRIDQICSLRTERIDPRTEGAQEFCIELEHIEPASGRLLGSSTASEQASLKTKFKVGDVLFGKLRAYQRKHWIASLPGVCSTEIWVLISNPEFSTPEFLYHLVSTDDFIEAASTAYGTHMPRSDWKVVRQVQVALPGLDEQTAIATVLSDMDAELATLEARRDKTRDLKQGMMQELLTGRIRLV